MSTDDPASVIVVHGLWMPGSETWLLRRRLAARGFRPFLFRYRTVGRGLDHNSDALARFAAGVAGRRVNFVGYSLGGVVCVNMFKRGMIERAGRLVCIGSPLNGSSTARALLDWPGGRRFLGRSVADLTQRGGLGHWDGPVELGSLAGCIGVGLGLLSGGLHGPNDGTVAVEETRIDGARDHVVRNVSHTTMLFSRIVADDIAHFLEHGRF